MDKEIEDLRRTGELSKPTRCLTPLLGDLEPETKGAISHIAAAVREPVQLKQWPPMKLVQQPDGSFRMVPVMTHWHSIRRRDINLFPPKPGLIFRLKRWLSKGGKLP